MMATTYRSGFDLNESSRPKSLGNLLICLYSSIVFLLMCFIGFFALRPPEENRQELFLYAHCSDMSTSPYDGSLKSTYCPPAVNIFFLKTHKCASSTVQNILMRYGDSRNLSFVLPKSTNYIGHPEHFSRWMVPEELSSPFHFNILCHHLRLDVNEVQEVLPQSTVYFSILRNPVSLFRSMYDYYNMGNFFNQTIEEFIQDEKSKEKLNLNRIYNKLGRNQMLFDFGYDKGIWDNISLIRNAIDEIDRRFDLVMISEYFDESLVLLKHKLCWSTADIVYLMHNMRTQNAKNKDDISSHKIEAYNAADKMLFDFFSKKLNRIIDTFGRDRMKKEVEDLRLWNNIWFNHCVKKMSSVNSDFGSEAKVFNSKVYNFILNDEPIAEMCKNLAMEELQYTEKLRTKQKLFHTL